MFYKDLGYKYIQDGLDKNTNGEKVTHYFYNVSIYNVDIIEDNLFSTMMNITRDNEIYTISFDYSSEILFQMLKPMPTTTQQQILKDIKKAEQGNRKVEFKNPVIIKNIQAQVGAIYQNKNEIYAPFIIVGITI